mgnify:CR=1 FL=1
MEKMLKNKVSIITGSGRGIGRAVALMFASVAGFQCSGHDRLSRAREEQYGTKS